MALFPVIMCGGAGSRLWPSSTTARPKPFLNLIGDQTLFGATVARMAPLVGPGSELIVVAGLAHKRAILQELDRLQQGAQLILEPQARDSAPAMAAAAVQAARLAPDAVIAVVASDHYIPDAEAFRAAVEAAAVAAEDGHIVTLGVRPTFPSTAFGYISADTSGSGAIAIRQFVEKPDAARAAAYITEGYLWNSGNFIARADVLLEELRRFVPEVVQAAEAALDQATEVPGGSLLGPAFPSAPKISIDYAVMEKTDRAAVLPVDFMWSDVGTWDAVVERGADDQGHVLRIDAQGGLARAAPGIDLAVIGANDLIVIAEPGQVLVAGTAGAARVREAADHFARTGAGEAGLPGQARALMDWMRTRALPVWTSLGVSEEGRFQETIDPDGRPVVADRRARVQPRQAYSLCVAGSLGWTGPWRFLAKRAMSDFEASHGIDTGGYQTLLAADGSTLNQSALNYDLAFVLLARAAMGDTEAAQPLLAFLDERVHGRGGYREADARPFQSNATMHLFEAFLAWDAIEPDSIWKDRADNLALLAIDRLIDREGGFIREVYDADWNPASGAEGRIVETGHQFEWSHLLHAWGARRGIKAGTDAARRLFQAGLRGVDPVRGVAVDELDTQLRMIRRTARLWHQTEWLKAALVLASADPDPALLDEAKSALTTIWAYLRPDGLWGDVMDQQGTVPRDVSPASTLYHLIGAIDHLSTASRVLPGFEAPLDLR